MPKDYRRHGAPSISSQARANGVNPKTAHNRLHNGWPVDRAVSTPAIPNVMTGLARRARTIAARIERTTAKLTRLLEQQARGDTSDVRLSRSADETDAEAGRGDSRGWPALLI